MKERLREAALGLGFAAVGFAAAEAHEDAAQVAAWVAEERHGTMRWMARNPERRGDPALLLPGARTVVSVAAGYHRPPPPAPEEEGARGVIARYAWGGDYHKRMKRKLVRLGREIPMIAPGARWTTTVDTRPFLDRAWAERAGVGWIGKSTNLIRKGAGSWFFLGAIVTDAALPPDPPARNYCGTCVRCMTACPTGAITGPYQLDARRCISYLTIEHEGPIPLELRPAIGTRIFGCDDCQDACPWNRFAVPNADPDFAGRADQQAPALLPLLALDEAAFRKRYAGTALLRAGRDRFVRNVAVALGNAGDPRALPALDHAATADRDPDVREHAAWAAARIRCVAAPNPVSFSKTFEPVDPQPGGAPP